MRDFDKRQWEEILAEHFATPGDAEDDVEPENVAEILSRLTDEVYMVRVVLEDINSVLRGYPGLEMQRLRKESNE